jgi:hypothetical protein
MPAASAYDYDYDYEDQDQDDRFLFSAGPVHPRDPNSLLIMSPAVESDLIRLLEFEGTDSRLYDLFV